MSRVYENQCVDCGLPCLGESCPYRNVPMDYCDMCEDQIASYHIDGKDMCELCARQYFKDAFDDMTIYELAEKFGSYACGI